MVLYAKRMPPVIAARSITAASVIGVRRTESVGENKLTNRDAIGTAQTHSIAKPSESSRGRLIIGIRCSGSSEASASIAKKNTGSRSPTIATAKVLISVREEISMPNAAVTANIERPMNDEGLNE